MKQPRKNFKEKGTCPSITLQCAIKAGEGRLFVKASATILCVRRKISLPVTILALTNSRTKYRQISMCRENLRRTGFSLIAIQAKLSSKMSVAVDCEYPKSWSVSRTRAGLPGWLLQIQPRRLKEKYYLVGNSSKKWDHHSSLKCSPCEIDEFQCRQPNQHQPNPTIHSHGDFHGCK